MGLATAAKGLLDLCRVGNLPTVWSNVLAASLLADAAPPPEWVLLLALSLSAFYLAGMALNDLCDLEYDRVHRPERPLPAGRVTLRGATGLAAFLAGAGLGVVALAPHRAAIAGALLLAAAIATYDLWHKENACSVLLMGLCRFLIFAVVSLALSGRVTGTVALAGACHFSYVVLISLVARHENRRGRYALPVIPLMLAGISLLDGVVLALLVGPVWLVAGVAGAALTMLGQRLARGD